MGIINTNRTKTKIVTLTVLLSLFLATLVNAQQQPKHAIQFMGGYSRHGSGDMDGIVFESGYQYYLSKKFSLQYMVRATINSGRDEILVTDANSGNTTDASVRYTTAGVQLGTNAGFSIVRSSMHELIVSAGPFVRYQSASNGTDGYSIYRPPVINVPAVLIGFDNRSPQQTISVGGLLQIKYAVSIAGKVAIGLATGFQTDTNGDVIPQAGIAIGRWL